MKNLKKIISTIIVGVSIAVLSKYSMVWVVTTISCSLWYWVNDIGERLTEIEKRIEKRIESLEEWERREAENIIH